MSASALLAASGMLASDARDALHVAEQQHHVETAPRDRAEE